MLQVLPALARESERFAGRITGADRELPVPSCPEWSVRDLIVHLGHVQRFWADAVRTADPGHAGTNRHPRPGADDDLGAWFRTGTHHLLDALADAGTDSPCWTWWDEPRTSGAVARHQVQEAAVHLWDLEAALGSPGRIDTEVADDGVGEFLATVALGAGDTFPGSLVFRAEDTGNEWIIGDRRRPSATVRAPASDLVLLLYRRLPSSAVELSGDAHLLSDFLDAG